MGAMKLGRINEPIAVPAKQNGYFPKTFVWRGRHHEVRAVEECWTVTHQRRPFGGTAQRHLFRVRTGEATFILSQDLNRGTWQLDRVVARRSRGQG